MGQRLGQHFLFDPRILEKIVDALTLGPDDDVLEIGPGCGPLTKQLVRRARQVVAIERDSRLVESLRDLQLPGLTVIADDALEVAWTQVMRNAGAADGFKVVGNVPYYISTPLIDKALDTDGVTCVVFLVQKEVADRLVALPGSKAYGALSIGVQCFAQVDRLFAVKAGSFRPPPKVESAVVRLTPREHPDVPVAARRDFRRFVVALFGQRRKQMANSLAAAVEIDRSEAAERLIGLGFQPQDRVETLTPHMLARLFEAGLR